MFLLCVSSKGFGENGLPSLHGWYMEREPNSNELIHSLISLCTVCRLIFAFCVQYRKKFFYQDLAHYFSLRKQ